MPVVVELMGALGTLAALMLTTALMVVIVKDAIR